MSRKTILNIHEIKACFSRYAAQVMKGRSFIIAHRNKPFAELTPLKQPLRLPLRFAVLKGQFDVPDGFNQPLPEFEKDFYGN